MLGFGEFVGRYADASNKLCSLEEFTRDGLERFKLIFMTAKFRDLLKEYERIVEVESRVEKLEKLVEQLFTEKKGEATEHAA